ncbi:unnamed protein product [Cuscuta campestris]|uniref:MADS-box domain-containing protein n=1 Tax=Cuscuta campestris TaxID=132261 RepID=A0A484MDJ2_9ASTE|nr:unnamed protein product [Cuscuta campestris]
MGRVKLEIKKIENTTNRQVTYSKRRNGLIKKAYELSVLCEIDVALIMFSPSGKPSVFSSNNKRVDSQSQIFNFLDSNAMDARGGGSVEGMGMTMTMMMPQLHHMQNGDELMLGGGGGDPNHVIGGSTSAGGGRIPHVDDAPWTPPHHSAPPQPQPGADDDVSLFPSTTYQRERAILEAFISQLTTPPLTQPDDLI